MIGILSAISARIKALRDDYTNARSTKIDNLDATVSSRAPSSTALSTAVWTSGKAALLDVPISSASFISDPRLLLVGTAVNSGSGGYWYSGGEGNATWEFMSTNWYNGSSESISHNAVLTSAGVWLTVADITSGGGVMGAIIGPYTSTGTISFKITVDGTAYTLTATAPSNKRFVVNWQVGIGITAITNLRDRMGGRSANWTGSVLRFSTSLKVEAQVSVLPGSSDEGRRVGVDIRRPADAGTWS